MRDGTREPTGPLPAATPPPPAWGPRPGGHQSSVTAALVAAVLLATAACSPADGTGANGTPAATSPGATATSPAPTPSGTPDGSGSPTSGSPTSGSPTSGSPPAKPGPVGLRARSVVAENLRAPWGLAFLADGTAFVSERDTARIFRIGEDGRRRQVGEISAARPAGEGGLLGLAINPDDERWLYAYYTAANDNRVVRMLLGQTLGKPQVLLDGIRKAGNHDGGRLAFGPDGMLYVATGDAGVPSRSQDRTSLNGKILRITATGRVPDDNPFNGSPVWSYGHRNVQGLAWDSRGRLWASEFGQNTWDELNYIRKGKNYGWPLVEGRSSDDRFVNPVVQWRPSTASPSGVAVVAGPRGEAVLVAGLRGARVWMVPADPTGKSGAAGDLLTGDYGRLRTVASAPDGSVWLVTSNTDGRASPGPRDDRILRLTLS